MAFEPPPYPRTLTRANWDSQKSILAKMKGFTGIGDGLDKVERCYKAVKWKELFDFEAKYGRQLNNWTATGFTAQKLEADVRAAHADVQTGSCGKLREAAFDLHKLAKETAAEYEKSKVIPSKTTQLCRTIATEADHLGVVVNMNHMSVEIEKSKKAVTAPAALLIAAQKNDYNRHIKEVEAAVVPVIKQQDYDTWTASGLMTKCRNLNTTIGNVPKMIDFGFDVPGDASKFRKLFNDLSLYSRVAAPFEQDAPKEEVKKHLAILLNLIKQARAMAA